MSEFLLRVPTPRLRIDREIGHDFKAFVDDWAKVDALQEIDEDHELIRDGLVVSLRIPIVDGDAAPVAFAVAWHDEPDLDAMPDPEGRLRCTVRRIGGALYAPCWLHSAMRADIDEPLASDIDGLRAMAANMFVHGHKRFHENPFLLPQVGGYAPSATVQDHMAVGAGMFVGATPAETAVRAAATDFALVDGLLLRRVGDPVLVATTAERGAERRLRLRVPFLPEFDALRRFRHDRAYEAEAFFAPRGGFRRSGRLIHVDPAYASSRDDALLCAVDFGRILLRSTAQFLHRHGWRMTFALMRAWAELRDDCAALDAGDLDPFDFFDRADGYADLCAHPADGLRTDIEPQSAAAGVVARTRKLASKRRAMLPARRTGEVA